ncbi:MAG: metallophosphoesterase [Kofleriaceae bacterium]
MRARLGLVVCLLVGTSGAAAAEPEGHAPRGATLLAPGAPWRWYVIDAPAIAPAIGGLAVSGLDVAAGRAAAPVAVLGEPAPEPEGWPFRVPGDRRAIGEPAADQRIAAAFGLATFSLTADDQGLQMLELRLRYQDGAAVWLNGIEIARSALPAGGATTQLAARPHGPEWETFHVPVAPGLLRLGANVLAIEVHPSGRRAAPSLEVELIGRRDRGIVRGPILAELGDTHATIAVETDPDTEAVIAWGTGEVLDQRQVSPPGRRHAFALAGLPANSSIRYRVSAGASRSRALVFRTPPPAGAVVRIGIYGDVRGGHAVHRRLVDHMLAEPLDAIAVTGDMVLRGSDEADWQRFFAVTAELLAQLPYYPAIGNHDLGWDGADQVKRAEEVFSLPAGPPGRPPGAYWYSRDVADVHLVFLDSNHYDLVAQEAWLEADLAAARARGVRAIVALTHDGPYSRGYHGGSALARARYVPILVRHGVDLVFSGHDHLYQRGERGGLRYVVTGGGGANLYGIRCGVAGRPRCATEDGMQAIAKEHHYAVLTIAREIELCVRRVDGALLEKCVRYPLGRR